MTTTARTYGTIAGVGGNGKGVAGVCWSGEADQRQVPLPPRRRHRQRGQGAGLLHRPEDPPRPQPGGDEHPWGGGGYLQALSDAIDRAGQAEILTIVADGNDSVNCEGNTSGACYPASYPSASIISVAALRSTGALVYNYGATTVDLGAPGYGIWSTVPKSAKGKVALSYASYKRHPMATPHVTGAAASVYRPVLA